MYSLKDVERQFPEAYPCGGELLAHIDGKNVALGHFGNNSFVLTEAGLELMRDVPVVTDEAPAKPKRKAKADAVADPDEVDLGDINLD